MCTICAIEVAEALVREAAAQPQRTFQRRLECGFKLRDGCALSNAFSKARSTLRHSGRSVYATKLIAIFLNPHLRPSTSIRSMFAGVWNNRQLLRALVWRDIQGRYRGSALGLAWSFVNPLILLVLYTFVFTVVFKARWGASSVSEDKAQFALMLFVGMIVHGVVAEVFQRASSQVVSQPNYVKKVVFPLEVLPLVTVGSALAHAIISLLVLLVAVATFSSGIPLTAFLLPIVWLPMLLLVSGAAWLFASIGVFVRDTSQIMTMLTTMLLFASPVFYPISALPLRLQPYLQLNPLTWIIEQSRAVLISGRTPDMQGWSIWMLVTGTVAIFGFKWFQKTRQGFADVL